MVTRTLSLLACAVVVSAACSGKHAKKNEENLPPGSPVADAGVDLEVAPNSPVELNGAGSYDPEGSPLTYAWVQTSGPSVQLSSTTAVTPTFKAPASGTMVFSLVVNDGELPSKADTVTVAVVERDGPRPSIDGSEVSAGGNSVITGLTDPRDLALWNGRLYVADGTSGLLIYDVNDAGSPAQVGSLAGAFASVEVDGTRVAAVGLPRGSNAVATATLIDASAPASPVIEASIDGGTIQELETDGTYVYVATLGSLQVIDTSVNPPAYQVFQSSSGAYSLDIDGDRLYAVSSEHGLQIFDISNRMHPTVLRNGFPGSYPRKIRVSGNYAYIIDLGGALIVHDVSNPASTVQMGNTAALGDPHDFEVVGSYAYVANGGSGLAIVNLSNPTSPQVVGSYAAPNVTTDVAVVGTRAFLAHIGGSKIVDVSNPAAPALLGDGGAATGLAEAIGSYVLVRDGKLLDISDAANVTTVGTFGFSSIISTARASGTHVAAGTTLTQLQFGNAATPAAPAVTHTLEVDQAVTSASLRGDRLFTTWGGDNDGVQIFDISTPTAPRPLSTKIIDLATKVRAATPDVALVGAFNKLLPLRTDALTVGTSLGTSPKAFDAFGGYGSVAGSGTLQLWTLVEPPTSYGIGLNFSEDGVDVDMDDTLIYAGLDASGLANGGLVAANIKSGKPELTFRAGLSQTPVAVAGAGYRAAALLPDKSVHVFDIPTTVSLDSLGSVSLGSNVLGLLPSDDGSNVVARTTDGLRVLDGTTPGASAIGSYHPAGSSFVSFAAREGDLVFAGIYTPTPAPASYRVAVVDVSTPSSPHEVGSYPVAGFTALGASGNLLVVANNTAVEVVDVSNPAAPTKVADYTASAQVTLLHVSGSLAVLRTVSASGLEIVDLSTPTQPAGKGGVGASYPIDFDLDGSALTLINNAGVQLYDLGDGGTVTGLGSYAVTAQRVVRKGNIVYAITSDPYGGWTNHALVLDASVPQSMLPLAQYALPANPVDVGPVGGALWFSFPQSIVVYPSGRDAVRIDQLRATATHGATVIYGASYTDLDSNRGETAQCVVTSGTCTVTAFDADAHHVSVNWTVGTGTDGEIGIIVGNDHWWSVAYDYVKIQ